MDRPVSEPSVSDGASPLTFRGWPGWTLLGTFVGVNAVIAALAGGPAMRDGQGVLALILLTGAGAIAVLSGDRTFDLKRVLAVIGLIAVSTLLMLEQLLVSGASGFLNWNYNAANFILFAVALRGRIAWAWIGLGVVSAITLTWSQVVTGGPWQGIFVVYGEVGSLLAGTFFAVVLRTATRRVRTLQRVRRQLVGQEHMLAETEQQRAAQLMLVRQRVIPVLTSIAEGRLNATQRREHRLLEAALRDEIRGARLAAEPLASAVRAARARGIDVVLLDDADEVRLEWDDLEWAADVIADIVRDSVTLRLSGDPVVITIATVDGSVVHRQIARR